MASKKDTQIKPVETAAEEAASTITYSSEVIATIAGMAVNDVEGVASMANVSGTKVSGKNKAITKGIKVEIGPEEVSCDLFLYIEYGRPIVKVATEVQENVRRSLETMTGLHVVRVDVHVQGISFEQEKSALTAGAQNAKLTSGDGKDKEKDKTKEEAQD